jgi:hypothetical protein
MIYDYLYKKQPPSVSESIEDLIKDLILFNKPFTAQTREKNIFWGIIRRNVKLYRFELEDKQVFIYKRIVVICRKNAPIQQGDEYFLSDDSAFRSIQEKEKQSKNMEIVNQIKILRYSINK